MTSSNPESLSMSSLSNFNDLQSPTMGTNDGKVPSYVAPSAGNDIIFNLIKSAIMKPIDAEKIKHIPFIIRESKFLPTSPIDDSGNTILHVIISNLQHLGGIAFLREILSYPNAKVLINVRNTSDGVSPMMLAQSLGLTEAVNILQEFGADPKLPTLSGEILETITDDKNHSQVIPQNKPMSLSPQPSDNLKTVSVGISNIGISDFPKHLSEFLSGITGKIKSTLSPKNPNTETYIQNVLSKAKTTPTIQNTQNTQNVGSNVTGGGGSKSIVVGQRTMNRYYDDYSGGSEKRKEREKVEISRLVDDIHTRVIETIQSIMNVDELTAKVYKSVLYHRVKDEQPSLSGHDRAIEMEKIATKEILSKINIDKEKEKYEDFIKKSTEEKEKRDKGKDKDGKKEKKTKKGKSSDIDSLSSSESDEKPKKEKKTKKSKKSEESSSSIDSNLSE
jgi:hypothetical protein